MNSILHSVTILFRVQDHLSRKLGEFASKLAGIETDAEDAQTAIKKLGLLDQKIGDFRNRQSLMQRQFYLDETRRATALATMRQRHAKQNETLLTRQANLSKKFDSEAEARTQKHLAYVRDLETIRTAKLAALVPGANIDRIQADLGQYGLKTNLQSPEMRAIDRKLTRLRTVVDAAGREGILPRNASERRALGEAFENARMDRASAMSLLADNPNSAYAQMTLDEENRRFRRLNQAAKAMEAHKQLTDLTRQRALLARSERGTINKEYESEYEGSWGALRLQYELEKKAHDEEIARLQAEIDKQKELQAVEINRLEETQNLEREKQIEMHRLAQRKLDDMIEEDAMRQRLLPHQQKIAALQDKLGKSMMWFGGGALAAMMGTAVLRGEYGAIKHFGQLSIQEQQAKLRLRGIGLSPQQYGRAWQMVSQLGPMGGANYAQAGETYAMLFSTLQGAPSRSLFKLAMQTRMVGSSIYGMSDQQLQAMFRASELMAPARGLTEAQRQSMMAHKLRQVMKIYAAMGGALNMTQFYSAVKTLRFGRGTFSDKGLMGFAALVQEMGSRAGSSVTQLQKLLIAPTNKAQEGLAALGLLNTNGTAKGYKKGMTNILDWITDYFLPAIEKHNKGKHLSHTDIAKEIAQVVPSVRAAGALATLVMQLSKFEQMLKRTKQIPSIEKAWAGAMRNPAGETKKLNADLSNLSATIGDDLNPLFIPLLKGLDGMVKGLTKFAKSPDSAAFIRWLTVLAGGLAAIAAVGGVLTMFTSGVGAFLTILKLKNAANLLKDVAGGEEDLLKGASGLRGLLANSLAPAFEGVTRNATMATRAVALLEFSLGALAGAGIFELFRHVFGPMFHHAMGDTTPPGTRGNANPLKLKAVPGSHIGPNLFPRFGGVSGSFDVSPMANPSPKKTLSPAAQTAAIPATIGPIHITVQGNATNPKDLAQQVADEFSKIWARFIAGNMSGPWSSPAKVPNTVGRMP